MNSSLSMLLRPSSHRILEIFSKKITSKIPFNKMKTTEHVNFIIPKEPPESPYPKHLVHYLFPKPPRRVSQKYVALNVFKQMNCPNYFTFDIAFFHLSHLNDIANSSHVLTHMLRIPCYPSTNHGFNNLLISFCKMK